MDVQEHTFTLLHWRCGDICAYARKFHAYVACAGIVVRVFIATTYDLEPCTHILCHYFLDCRKILVFDQVL